MSHSVAYILYYQEIIVAKTSLEVREQGLQPSECLRFF